MKIFGHRGAPGIPRVRENTVRSFRKALDEGADGLEMDVRRCADGSLVVIHDRTFLPYEKLQQSEVPQLREVLRLFGSQCILNLELKEHVAAGVRQLIEEAGCAGNVIVSAFDGDDNDADSSSSWEDLKIFPPEIRIGLLATARKISQIGIDGYIQSARRLSAVALHPQRTGPIQDLLAAAKSAGLAVHIWTVNNPEEIARFRMMGVDAIFTDVPALARAENG